MAPKVILGGGFVLEVVEVVCQPLSENLSCKRGHYINPLPERICCEEFVHHPDDGGSLSIRYPVKDFTDLVRVFHRN